VTSASRILPVLDLLNGQVVRGVGGRRDEYRPIVSNLVKSSAPLEVARALRGAFGGSDLYVADLDAIAQKRPHDDVIRSLLDEGFRVDLDRGVRTVRDIGEFERSNRLRHVLGLETLNGPAELVTIAGEIGDGRLVFSLDLRDGQLQGSETWPKHPLDVLDMVVQAGLTSVIVLDVAAVGLGGGCPTVGLCRQVRSRWRELEIITGGGVRSMEDVEAAVCEGVDRVLVASALHDGRIKPLGRDDRDLALTRSEPC
jgi:phosphoribosylformimino-5-aminoimidazole carboxamide ribotide isomerase